MMSVIRHGEHVVSVGTSANRGADPMALVTAEPDSCGPSRYGRADAPPGSRSPGSEAPGTVMVVPRGLPPPAASACRPSSRPAPQPQHHHSDPGVASRRVAPGSSAMAEPYAPIAGGGVHRLMRCGFHGRRWQGCLPQRCDDAIERGGEPVDLAGGRPADDTRSRCAPQPTCLAGAWLGVPSPPRTRAAAATAPPVGARTRAGTRPGSPSSCVPAAGRAHADDVDAVGQGLRAGPIRGGGRKRCVPRGAPANPTAGDVSVPNGGAP
jgi:hypothetical protein